MRVSGLLLLSVGALVAGTDQTSRPVNWDRARAELARYRAIADNSGLVEVDAQISPRIDAENLTALCEGRREAVRRARQIAGEGLRALPPGRDPITDERRAQLHRQLGAVASFEGDMPKAARHFAEARDALTPYVNDYPDLRARRLALEQAVGTAWLRQGEIENCLTTSSADRCLFPVRPGGRHQHARPAEAALQHFTSYLRAAPEDLEGRWLVNVTAMVLGRYPNGVPEPFRMAPALFASKARMTRFVDISTEAQLGRMDLAGGTIADDFDGDGRIDVVFSSVDFCSPLRLYSNRGDGTFEDRTESAGLLTQLGGINLTHTDYNNDGRLDIFVHRGGWEIAMRNSLLRANGDGTFTDVTREAGLSSAEHATHSAAWLDYDNDGWVDVFVAHELTPSQLFRNRGDGTFEDVSARAGVGRTSFAKGIVAGDYDNDGWADVYVSNMFGDNFLYRNNRDGTFTERAASAGVQKPFVSFPTWFFDYDNDGWLDLFVVSYPNSVEEFVKHYVGERPSAETLALYRNNHDGTFKNVSVEAGLARVVPAMGANFGDLENDGYLDMYLGTGTPSFGALMPNIMLRNDDGRRFVDVTEATGTGHLQKGHGIAFADLDRDGDQDVVLNVGGAVPGDRYEDALFQNPGQPGGNWIAIRLIGTKSNRAAIGARIRLTLTGAGGRSILRHREVTSGGSFGANPFEQHIGVGRANVIDVLEVYWPASRTTQTLRNVPVNQRIELREGVEGFSGGR